MAHRNNDEKLKNLKKEMEEVKTKLQKLPDMENAIEHLTQGLSRALVALQETQRSVQSMARSNSKEKAFTQELNFGNLPIIKLPPYSNLGVMGPNTMKFKGRIGLKEVRILIKPRASMNFISMEVVEELRLKIRPTWAYRIVLEGDMTRTSCGICKGVKLEMEGVEIMEDYLPFRLAGHVDIILGMKWLKTLRKIDIDWGQLTLKFVRDGSLIFLKA